eukprot:TRINITY_DN8165_c0_g1_i1.p1 TRINITY_DN8165_c0_g1~~TRINITY_DN8165_c0_g1_i1.p1  ORF type:complete len:505 (-),score=63.74 TRINITY_DN8165_c0_g1_i1:59-1573(-)
MEPKDIEPSSGFDLLATELWLMIFRYLSLAQLIKLSGVSKSLRSSIVGLWSLISPDNVSIVVCGPPQSGKTSLIAQLRIFNGFRAKHKNSNFDSRKIHLLIDDANERLYGFTSRSKTFPIKLSGLGFNLTIIDTPGNFKHRKNMIRYFSMSDCALIMLDIRRSDEDMVHFRDLLMTAYFLLGTINIAVAINFMSKVQYAEQIFRDFVLDLQRITLKIVGKTFIKRVRYIPVDVIENDNVCRKSVMMPWFSGDCLLSSLVAFHKGIETEFDKSKHPLRLPIDRVYLSVNSTLKGPVVTGCILEGHASTSKEVVLAPPIINVPNSATVVSIETFGTRVSSSFPGNYVGLNLVTAKKEKFAPKRGQLLCSPQDVTKPVVAFMAKVYGSCPRFGYWSGIFSLGYSALMHYECSRVYVRLKTIVQVQNKGEIVKFPRSFSNNRFATVVFTVEGPICMETYTKSKDLKKKNCRGRFVIVDQRRTVLGGIVIALRYKGNNNLLYEEEVLQK